MAELVWVPAPEAQALGQPREVSGQPGVLDGPSLAGGVLTDPVGTVRCTRDADGSPFIRVTSTDATTVFLRLTYPVWLGAGTR